MRTSSEKRLEKLKAEVAKFATTAEFARAYDLDETYIRQLLTGHRSFGERSARNMGLKMFGDSEYFFAPSSVVSQQSPSQDADEIKIINSPDLLIDELVRVATQLDRKNRLMLLIRADELLKEQTVAQIHAA